MAGGLRRIQRKPFSCPVAVRYIREQKAHHKKMDFAAEFVRLLKKHGIEFDSRYVLG